MPTGLGVAINVPTNQKRTSNSGITDFRIRIEAQMTLRFFLAATFISASFVSALADDFEVRHQRAVAVNPEGLHLSVALATKTQTLRIGDSIRLEYTFTADTADGYLANETSNDRMLRSILESFIIDRPEDAVDPVKDFFALFNAMDCFNFPNGGFAAYPIAHSPLRRSVVLTHYLHFNQPGHYRLYVVTRQVMPVNAKRLPVAPPPSLRQDVDDSSLFYPEQRPGGPPLTSENIIEFDLLPQVPDEAESEVQKIIADTNRFPGTKLNLDNAYRLFEIATPSARKAAAQLYPYWRFNSGLVGIATVVAAPRHSEAISLLQARLKDPQQPPDMESLFYLELLRLMDEDPKLTAESVLHGGRGNGDQRRMLLAKRIGAEVQQLIAGLNERPPSERAITVQMLNAIDDHRLCSVPLPIGLEVKAQLRAARLTALPDMPEQEQANALLNFTWAKDFSKEQIVPVMIKIFQQRAAAPPGGGDYVSMKVLAIIAERDPDLASNLFRRRMIDQHWVPEYSSLLRETQLRISGSPELDKVLIGNFENGSTREKEQIAPLFPLVATPGLLPQLKKIYESKGGDWTCSLSSSILAYLLKVDPAYGLEATKKAAVVYDAMAAPQCRRESLLADMAELRDAPELRKLAEIALNDPRPSVATGAARVLTPDYSSAADYKLLLPRLRQLHQQWSDLKAHPGGPQETKNLEKGYFILEDRIVGQLFRMNDSPEHLAAWKEALDLCSSSNCLFLMRQRIGRVPQPAASVSAPK